MTNPHAWDLHSTMRYQSSRKEVNCLEYKDIFPDEFDGSISVEKLDKNKNLQALRERGFERIADRLDAIWGSPEAETYFYNLIVVTDRDHRNGFPLEVFTTLLRLHNIHRVVK